MGGAARLVAIGFILGCIGGPGCFGGGGTQSVPMSGSASVPGAPPGAALRVVVVSLDGALLGQGEAAGGGFSLTAAVPSGTGRVLVTALAPGDPERRAMALVDVAAPAFDGAALPLSGGKADDGNGLPGISVDSASTATALVAAATGDLGQDLGALRTRYGAAITTVSGQLAGGGFPLCSVDASAATGAFDPMQAALSGVTNDAIPAAPEDPAVPDLIRELVTESRRDRPVEQRLRNMQRMISQVVYSLNNPRITGNVDYVLGVMPLVLLRTTLWAMTQEEATGISDTPLSRGELNRLAGMIAGMKWGNCREKAYMGAFAAALVPEVKQVAVVGMVTRSGGSHALAVACLDGPEVFDLSRFGGGALGGSDFSVPPAAAGRCFVVDPWQGPASDLTAGHTEVLDAGSADRWGWQEVDIVKRVLLNGQPLTRALALVSSVDCGLGGGSCSAFVPPDEPGPDVVDAGAPDAGAPDVGPPEEDVLQCPTYEPDGQSCGASLDGCIEGFYCSRETIACEQSECPLGSGRTYTLECCCNCWDDQSMQNVYDPCRAGFLLRCEPR